MHNGLLTSTNELLTKVQATGELVYSHQLWRLELAPLSHSILLRPSSSNLRLVPLLIVPFSTTWKSSRMCSPRSPLTPSQNRNSRIMPLNWYLGRKQPIARCTLSLQQSKRNLTSSLGRIWKVARFNPLSLWWHPQFSSLRRRMAPSDLSKTIGPLTQSQWRTSTPYPSSSS